MIQESDIRVQFSVITRDGFQAYWASPTVSKINGFVEENSEFFQYSKVMFLMNVISIVFIKFRNNNWLTVKTNSGWNKNCCQKKKCSHDLLDR